MPYTHTSKEKEERGGWGACFHKGIEFSLPLSSPMRHLLKQNPPPSLPYLGELKSVFKSARFENESLSVSCVIKYLESPLLTQHNISFLHTCGRRRRRSNNFESARAKTNPCKSTIFCALPYLDWCRQELGEQKEKSGPTLCRRRRRRRRRYRHPLKHTRRSRSRHPRFSSSLCSYVRAHPLEEDSLSIILGVS